MASKNIDIMVRRRKKHLNLEVVRREIVFGWNTPLPTLVFKNKVAFGWNKIT
jgi:hypothetical protein